MKNINDFVNYISDKYHDLIIYSWFENGVIQNRTYSGFREDTAEMCTYLHRFYGKGKNIALVGDMSYSWVCMFYAIMLSGNIAVPLDTKLSPEELASRIDFADVSIVFISRKYENVKKP